MNPMVSLGDRFQGGSLNQVQAVGDRVIKSYRGSISRGMEKLQQEAQWLNAVPPDLTNRYPFAFPTVLKFESKATTKSYLSQLHLTKIDRPTITKSILLGEIDSETACRATALALDFLVEQVYPLRNDIADPNTIYRSYHAKRIALARKYLRRLPYLQPLLGAAELRVNGITCPTINQFLAWLDANNSKVFKSQVLTAMHGNLHCDNILFKPEVSLDSQDDISLIDPRGDLLGPAHYDFAKLLITLEAYYDEIHYGGFEVNSRLNGRAFDIEIELDTRFNPVYEALLGAVQPYVSRFAQLEDVDPTEFVSIIWTTQCIHILSFSFYHAYRLDTHPDRILAFFAIFALISRRLIGSRGRKISYDFQESRLEIE